MIYIDTNDDTDAEARDHIEYDFYSFDISKPTSRYNKVSSGVGYIYQLWEYLKANEKTLDWENLVIIGDWNSNAQWDKKRKVGNHSDVCNFLNSKGLVSSYHSEGKISQGEETDNTFFMHRNLNKGYHIDYLFAASKFLSHSEKMNIGDLNKWLQYSDHLPISYQLNID